MATDFYRLTLPPPCRVGDTVQIGSIFYKVTQLEPLYYEFRNIVGGVDVGFNTGIYAVPDLIPAKNFVHYICSFGIEGRVEAQIRYQAGAPRNTVGARSSLRLSRLQANWLLPFTFRLAVVAGDTLECDIEAAFAGVRAAIWFYGWKLNVVHVQQPPATDPNVVVLEDVRQV